MNMNTRNKNLYFVETFNGQYIENSFFKKSLTIWNRLLDDKICFKNIPTYRKAKTCKNDYLLLFKEVPTSASYGKVSIFLVKVP